MILREQPRQNKEMKNADSALLMKSSTSITRHSTILNTEYIGVVDPEGTNKI